METQVVNIADGNSPTVREIGETLLESFGLLDLIPIPGPSQQWVGMSPRSVPLPICLDTCRLVSLMGPLFSYRDKIVPTAAWALEQLKGRWAEAFPRLAAYPFPLFNYRCGRRLHG